VLVRLLILAAVVAAAVASCGLPHHAPAVPAPAGATRTQAPAPVDRSTARAEPADYTDPASVAAAYVAAICPYSWQQPYGAREHRAVGYLTPTAGRLLTPTPAGRAEWLASVVRDRLVGACQVIAAQVMAEGPNSNIRRYVRVVAHRLITGAAVPRREDDPEYALALTRTAGRWLVDGTSPGG
jgi:hypothetical protein